MLNETIIMIIFTIKISKNNCNYTIDDNDYNETIMTERRALLDTADLYDVIIKWL